MTVAGQSQVMAESLSFSIVIINHNYREFLQKAVESALAQSYPLFEVIVVDDGSIDNSLELLGEYGNRIQVIAQANAGHVSAVNTGFNATRGDLVLFLDADDVLYDACLAEVSLAWRRDAAKIQFQLDTIDGEGVDQHMTFPAYAQTITEAEIRQRSLSTGYYTWPVSSGNVYSRKYLDKLLPIDSARIFKSPDGFLNKMAPLFGPVLTLRRALGAYRVHGRNAWAQSPTKLCAKRYVRGTHFDAVLHQAFVEAAGRLGHEVPSFEMAPVPQWHEVRMLSLRLARPDHPFKADSVSYVWFLGTRAAWKADGLTVVGRLLWICWFSALAALPLAWLNKLISRWRSQTQRTSFIRRLISFSRMLVR